MIAKLLRLSNAIRSRIFLVVAGFSALVLCLSLFFPIYSNFCVEGSKPPCVAHHFAVTLIFEFLKYANDYGGAITALATVAVAAFTWTLYRATTEQGRLTEHSIQLARNEFNATHRPEIVVQSVQFNAPIVGTIHNATQYIAATVIFYNRGATSANITGFTGEITARRIPPPVGNDLDPIVEDLPTLKGGEGSWIQVTSRIPRKDFDLYSSSKESAILCIGTIEYVDGLGTRRVTGYCRRLDRATSGERWVIVEEEGYGYEYAY